MNPHEESLRQRHADRTGHREGPTGEHDGLTAVAIAEVLMSLNGYSKLLQVLSTAHTQRLKAPCSLPPQKHSM